jgi:hypothetical protein
VGQLQRISGDRDGGSKAKEKDGVAEVLVANWKRPRLASPIIGLGYRSKLREFVREICQEGLLR